MQASNQELEAVVAAHRDTIQQCNTTFVEALRDLLNVADAQQVGDTSGHMQSAWFSCVSHGKVW